MESLIALVSAIGGAILAVGTLALKNRNSTQFSQADLNIRLQEIITIERDHFERRLEEQARDFEAKILQIEAQHINQIQDLKAHYEDLLGNITPRQR